MRQHQTMSPVTKSKAENLQPSKWTFALDLVSFLSKVFFLAFVCFTVLLIHLFVH